MKHFSPSNPHDLFLLLIPVSLAISGIIHLMLNKHTKQDHLKITTANGNEYTVNSSIILSLSGNTLGTAPFWILSPHRYRAGNSIQFSGTRAGNIFLSAVLNNKVATAKVFMSPANTALPTAPTPRAVIIGPAQVFAGQPCIYYCRNDSARSYQWRLMSDSNSLQTANSFRVTFRYPGEQHLTLTLNNDPTTTVIKLIQVLAPDEKKPVPQLAIPTPIPAIPAAAKPVAPTVSDPAFQQLFLQLVEGKKDAAEILQYLCNQTETMVVLNDKQAVTFLQCCHQLQNKRNIRLLSMSLARSDNGCIEAINIRLDRKKFIGLFK